MYEHHDTLLALHRQLAYRPDRESLAVTFSDDNARVSIDDHPAVNLPKGIHPQYVADMLAHYPVPVLINGHNIYPSPRLDEFSIVRASTEGDVSDATLRTVRPLVGRYHRSMILLDSVLYTLANCPELKADHPWHLVVRYQIPDRQDQQPHYARWSEYRILPGYRWDTNAPDDFAFSFTSGDPIRCHPPATVYRQLQEQRRQPEARAAALIKQHKANGPLPEPDLISDWDYANPPRSPRSYGETPAPLIPYAETATMDQISQTDDSTSQCLAYALYRDPNPGLVPVAYGIDEHGKLPDIVCVELNVVHQNGTTEQVDPTVSHANITNARAITAHLIVEYPDRQCREADLPLDLFCNGYPGDETVIITDRWRTEHIPELTERLYRNYIDASQDDGFDLRDHVETLATRLLTGDRAAHQAQLQRLCNRYFPQGNAAGIDRLTVANERHRITWEPVRQTPADQAAQLIADLEAVINGTEPLSGALWQTVTRHTTGQGYEYWTITMADDSVLDVNPIPSAAPDEPWLWAVVHSGNSGRRLLCEGMTANRLYQACRNYETPRS